MRLFKALALTGLVALGASACADLEVTNLNDPDQQRAITTPSDVETLISGAYYSFYRVTHRGYPNAAFSTAADAHTSSWGNWGMRDSGWEPRKAFNNDPSYSYNNMAESPWALSYRALAGVRDGLAAIDGGIVIEEGGQDVTQRAVAFGKFIQGMAHAALASVFDQAFVVDENSDLEALELVPYTDVWAAAEQKFAEAISAAQGTNFTFPAQWVGGNTEWTSSDFVQFVKAFRARWRTKIPRTPAERDAVDWNSVLTDLSAGLPFDFGGYYDGATTSWWDRKKLHTAGIPGWARIDNRTVGPADVSGNWEVWIAASPDDKEPFDITTPDSRITQPMQPTTEGKYFTYYGNSPFPASRGIYHYGHYIDYRYNFLWLGGYIGFYVDFNEAEVDFLRAEAHYRLGNVDEAMAIVNKYRANGDLPPFTSEQNPAGPDMCVPQMPDGSCGDLWEALKYEKRIECFHVSFGTEFFDDRGWGDLVEDTFIHLPVPGSELLLLLMDIYTFGGPGDDTAAPGGGVTPNIINDFSPEALKMKRRALERFDEYYGTETLDPDVRH